MDNSTTPPINGDKLSGQLVIKAQLGDDIRKMMIHNEDLTFNGNKNLTKNVLFKFFFRTCSHDGTYIYW